jgi:hypothetical protein
MTRLKGSTSSCRRVVQNKVSISLFRAQSISVIGGGVNTTTRTRFSLCVPDRLYGGSRARAASFLHLLLAGARTLVSSPSAAFPTCRMESPPRPAGFRASLASRWEERLATSPPRRRGERAQRVAWGLASTLASTPGDRSTPRRTTLFSAATAATRRAHFSITVEWSSRCRAQPPPSETLPAGREARRGKRERRELDACVRNSRGDDDCKIRN